MQNLRVKLAGIAAAFAMTVLAAPAGAGVVTYDLNVDTCTGTCGAASYGTVKVTDLVSGGVHVTVTLDPGVNFVKTGALSNYAFVFSLSGGPNIAVSNLTTADFSATDVTGGVANISAGGTLGKFEYGIACSACGNGGSSPKHGPIDFDLLNPAITTASFLDGVWNGSQTGYFFVVDIMGPNEGTGRVAATQGHGDENPPPPDQVPEPLSLSILAAALAGLGLRRRRRA